MTDDVAVIKLENNQYQVVSSYPSQKLWQDSIDYYQYPNSRLTSLLQENRRDKYHVDIKDEFYQGQVPLKMIVELVHNDSVSFEKIKGFSILQKIIDNIYLKRSMLSEKEDGEIIRYAIGIAQNIPFYQISRNNDKNSIEIIYKMLNKEVNNEAE